MAEIIDLTEYLWKKKFLRFLREGFEIDLDDHMLEEFQFLLEAFLAEVHKDITLVNNGDNTIEIQHLNQTFMSFLFEGLSFHVSFGSEESDPFLLEKIGAITASALRFWEIFEKEIPMIQQSFL